MKSLEERLEEMKQIYVKLNDLGITEQTCCGISKFKVFANDFVKNGISYSGSIKLQEINRKLVYILSTQKHIVSNVVLQSL